MINDNQYQRLVLPRAANLNLKYLKLCPSAHGHIDKKFYFFFFCLIHNNYHLIMTDTEDTNVFATFHRKYRPR